MNEETIQDIKAFDALPETPEKIKIKQDYLADKTCSLDFYCQCMAYMRSVGRDDERK
jgi:hypothetical protein